MLSCAANDFRVGGIGLSKHPFSNYFYFFIVSYCVAATLVSMKLSEQRIAEIMETWPVARLATQGWSPVDGKPKADAELARIGNLKVNPIASLLIDHYSDDWSQLWWLRLSLSVEVMVFDRPAADQDFLLLVTKLLKNKYRQYETVPVFKSQPTLLAMTPTKFTSWSYS
jgi:hypothetical protein